MKKLLSLFFVVLLAGQSFTAGANELTLCEGEYYSNSVPIYGLWADTENTIGQMIYPADMLEDMIGREITSVKFYTLAYYYNNYGDPSSIQSSDLINFYGATVELSFKVVDETSFEGRIDGAVHVAQTIPEKGADNMTFILDEPFCYEGGNLLIECKVIVPGDYGTTRFFGTIFDDGVNCCYYGYEGYYEWTEAIYSFLPMVTFTFNEEVPPMDEMTLAPEITLERLEGSEGYYSCCVFITEDEPSVIYYRVLRYDYELEDWVASEWMLYETQLDFNESGFYRVEAYAVAEGKLPSLTVFMDFSVSMPDDPITTLGDLNGDNAIDVADVTALISMVLGNAPLNIPVADINHDGNVDVADVTALITHVLAGTSPTK